MHQKIIQFLKDKPLKIVFIVFAILVIKELIYVTTFRNQVSPIADGYSEANTIRGATFFHEKGLSYFKGLPDICYSDLLLDKGVTGHPEFEYTPSAYTHYPPGPEYMAWLGFQIVGARNFNLLRLLPITLSIIVGIFFINTMYNFVGGGLKGSLFCLMLILPPMYSNYMHGLHHQQYAFLLFQIQICLCILFFSQEKWRTWKTLFAFTFLGFLHGWMTFDFAFQATLFVIPFFFYFKERAKFSHLIIIGLCSGLSYTLAHILHFFQVVAYEGSLEKAFEDFFLAAKFRAANGGNEVHTPLAKYDPEKIGPITVAKDFLYRVAGRGKYLAINLINFIWIIIGLKFIKKISFKKGWTFDFSVTGNDLLALFAAVVVSSGWSLVMKQHAHIHGFVARHYYLAYFFCCLILIERTKKVPEES